MAASDEEDITDLTVKQKQHVKSIKKKMKRFNSDDSNEEDNASPSSNTSFERHSRKRQKHHLGNKNASKSPRKVEIGWIHNGKSVRTKSGGGTRKLDIPNSANTDRILQEGRKIFSQMEYPLKVLKLIVVHLSFTILTITKFSKLKMKHCLRYMKE